MSDPLCGHLNYVMSVDFSPRGNLLASASFDESVRLWDSRTGRSVRAVPAHSEPVTSARFNGDGTVIVTGSYDGLMWVAVDRGKRGGGRDPWRLFVRSSLCFGHNTAFSFVPPWAPAVDYGTLPLGSASRRFKTRARPQCPFYSAPALRILCPRVSCTSNSHRCPLDLHLPLAAVRMSASHPMDDSCSLPALTGSCASTTH